MSATFQPDATTVTLNPYRCRTLFLLESEIGLQVRLIRTLTCRYET